MQRFLRGAVACLLTANGFAIAVIAGGDAVTSAQSGAEAPAGRTVTLVTSKDGTRYLADRSTPEGRQAIENALKNGATVEDVAAKTSDSGKPIVTLPVDLTGLKLPIDLNSLPKLPIDLSVVTGAVGAVEQHLNDIADTAKGTATTLVDAVGGVVSTLPTVPGVTVPTVPGVTVPTVPGVTVPPVTAPPATLPPVTVPPVTLPPVTLPPVTLPPVTVPHL